MDTTGEQLEQAVEMGSNDSQPKPKKKDPAPRQGPKSFPGALLHYDGDDKEQEDFEEAAKVNSFFEGLGPIFRSACIEFMGSIVLEVVSLGIIITSLNNPTVTTPIYPIALLNGVLITFLIFAFAAPSGGHVNPLITIATTFTGMCEIRRCVLYLIAQFSGCTIGALIVSLGRNNINDKKIKAFMIGGCSYGDLPDGSALLLEIAYSFLILNIAYGTAFDPRQGKIYGQFFAPWFIGLGIAMVIYSSSGLKIERQYIGAGINPARCFGPSMVTLDFNNFWIYIFGPVIAAIIHAPIYNLAPPNHAVEYEKKKKELSCGIFKFVL